MRHRLSHRAASGAPHPHAHPLLLAVLILSLSACGTPRPVARSDEAAAHPAPLAAAAQASGAPREEVAQGAASAATPGVERRAADASAKADDRAAVMAPATPAAMAPERYAPPRLATRNMPGYVQPYVPAPVTEHERYATLAQNGVIAAAAQPFSTFSIDVDTGAYANVRRMLMAGRLPPGDAVRVEEMINYFPWETVPQARAGRPFAVRTEVAPSPWNADNLLLRVGIRAMDARRAELPPANLVFLVDVSGSMNDPAKLPLLKNALRLLVDTLRAEDTVSLVTYASGTRVVLPPTSGRERARIRSAIEQLRPGGATAGEAGIRLAYAMAQQGYRPGGINRILLATDGDFNVGVSDFPTLKAMVEEQRRSGVSLTTLGFGAGNYREDLMEQLADAGDGNYAYIDTLNEAHKVLVEQAASTLSIVARDVKIQMEFNPAVVAEYRLIGYENRALAREDFRNDKVDAGEVGAGHGVTALYELTLVGRPGLLGETRYRNPSDAAAPAGDAFGNELGTLRLRYKAPEGGASREMAVVVTRSQIERADRASDDLRFTAAVAAFGQYLRGGKYLGQFGPRQIEQLAAGARGADRFGYRGEFLRLVRLAGALQTPASASGCGSDGDCAD